MPSLLAAALAAAGCGLGPGPGVGEVSLTVTRDFGAARVQPPLREGASESDTAMRVLDRNADLGTAYGGRYVRSIDGLAEASRDGRRYDWFFYVDGVEASVGAADFPLRGGEAIWWDYRDWSGAVSVPAVVGAWPAPLAGGYWGERRPAALECRGAGAACGAVRRRLGRAGVGLGDDAAPGGEDDADGTDRGTGGGGAAENGAADGAIRVLVGPWRRLRADPAAAQLERGPQASGVYADFVPTPTGSFELRGLDEDGGVARVFGAGAGLVAATRRYGAPPVWLVTGATARGVRAAAGLLDAADLRDHYAVAIEGGAPTPLPVAPERRSTGAGEIGRAEGVGGTAGVTVR